MLVDDQVIVNLVAQRNEPVQIHEILCPIDISEPTEHTYIINMGQNLVGWVQFTIEGEEGQQIQLRHGEMLDLDGSLYTDNLRLASQTDTYILNGKGLQTLHPHFTFHGFQYVEITGLSQQPDLSSIKGIALSSNPPVSGAFECSNPMLNQLWHNILWTQRDNMVTIPTDCPQRNKRMGWMGDAPGLCPECHL